MVHNVSSSTNKLLILRQLYTFFTSMNEKDKMKYHKIALQ